MSQAPISECPNLHAAPPRLNLGPDVALVGGYQRYTALPRAVVPDERDAGLCKKRDLLAPVFTPALLENRSVLDLGANNAFFSLWALHIGAASATAVDMDPQCQQLVTRISQHMNYQGLTLANARIQDWRDPADVVLALALVHWVYSCTADFGSLDAVIGWLAGLSRHALIVEWIAPRDGAIAHFHHTDFQPEVHREAYTYAAFRAALGRHFARVVYLGHLTDTRSLFIACKRDGEVDLSGPLPLLHDPATIVSSRFLASAGALDFWSRVYDLGDSILKQSSFDLASREADFLALLAGPHYPRVFAANRGAGYSTVRLEKIAGHSAQQAAALFREDAGALLAFIGECLDILEELSARGIRHRDIRPDNVLVRDGHPVLIDFGWAVSPSLPYYTPAPFAAQPANCDMIGMAGVIAAASGGRFPAIAPALAEMARRDPLRAPVDTATLRRLFHQALAPQAGQFCSGACEA